MMILNYKEETYSYGGDHDLCSNWNLIFTVYSLQKNAVCLLSLKEIHNLREL